MTAEAQQPRPTKPKAKEVACLFLDLDGTVRHGPGERDGRFISGPDDVKIFPEVPALLKQYRRRGFRIFILSNQGGIESRQVKKSIVVEALDRTKELLSPGGECLIDGLYYCPHWLRDGKPHCFCRKPQIGMLCSINALLRKQNNELVSFERSLVVGDRAEDEALAENAGLSFMAADEWRAGKHLEGLGK